MTGLTEMVGTQTGWKVVLTRENGREGPERAVLLREPVTWGYSTAAGSS